VTVPEFYTCRHCSTAKTADNFYPNSRVQCKACISKKNKEKYRQKNDKVRTYIKGDALRPAKVRVVKKACPACDKQHPVSDGVLCFTCVRSESVRKQHGVLTAADFSLSGLNRRERMLLFLYACGQDISGYYRDSDSTPSFPHPDISDLQRSFTIFHRKKPFPVGKYLPQPEEESKTKQTPSHHETRRLRRHHDHDQN